jgi:hypothetical protein
VVAAVALRERRPSANDAATDSSDAVPALPRP